MPQHEARGTRREARGARCMHRHTLLFALQVMELFIYMHMGGSLERVKVIPIYKSAEEGASQATPLRARAELSEQFQNFDAAKAQCFKNSDRERLLAVIEAAFGDCTEFNKSARNLLTTRLSTSGHFHIGFGMGAIKKKVGSFVVRGARRLSMIGPHPVRTGGSGESTPGRRATCSGRRSSSTDAAIGGSVYSARRSTMDPTASPRKRSSEAQGSRVSGGSQRRSFWSRRWSSESISTQDQASRGLPLTSIFIGDGHDEPFSHGSPIPSISEASIETSGREEEAGA